MGKVCLQVYLVNQAVIKVANVITSHLILYWSTYFSK